MPNEVEDTGGNIGGNHYDNYGNNPNDNLGANHEVN